MTPTRMIWSSFLILTTLVVGFRFAAGDRLKALFSDQTNITRALAIESITAARAGKVVTVAPTIQATQYTVKKGDSWSSIARVYKISDYNALAKHNDFISLRPGLKLDIPAELMEHR